MGGSQREREEVFGSTVSREGGQQVELYCLCSVGASACNEKATSASRYSPVPPVVGGRPEQARVVAEATPPGGAGRQGGRLGL